MKCIVLIAALCCLGVCAGQITTDFLTDNLLNPMINEIYNNAISMLGQQLTALFSGLFVGKRALPDIFNLNIAEVLAPFIAKVKEVYQRLFKVFLQIVQNAGAWIEKPDWARIEFVNAGVDAENELARINLGVEFLQPLVSLVQQHLQALIDEFQGIIYQVLDAAKHPLQSLIGAGNLLQP
jgi:hypothetical protein